MHQSNKFNTPCILSDIYMHSIHTMHCTALDVWAIHNRVSHSSFLLIFSSIFLSLTLELFHSILISLRWDGVQMDISVSFSLNTSTIAIMIPTPSVFVVAAAIEITQKLPNCFFFPYVRGNFLFMRLAQCFDLYVRLTRVKTRELTNASLLHTIWRHSMKVNEELYAASWNDTPNTLSVHN